MIAVAHADSFQVLTINGQAEISPDKKDWENAQSGQMLSSGTWIKTGANAKVTILLPDRTQTIIARNSEVQLNKPIGEVSLAKLLEQILSLSKKFDIEVQPQFTLLQKTMLMAEGTTRQINPNINMWELSRPLIDKWITDTHDPFKVLEEWFHKNKIALLKIPEIIRKVDEILSKK